MRILAPFTDQAGRRRTLYRYYHVQPKPVLRPTRQPSGKELLQAFAAVILGAVGIWVLLVLWPIGERISR